MRVCIVTEELVGLPNSGGIGTAFSELAGMLAANGAEVQVLVCRAAEWAPELRTSIAQRAQADGYGVHFLDLHQYAWAPHDAAKRAFCVYQYLKGGAYDVIHFADYLANGYYCMLARSQGLAFGSTLLVTQMHGPSRWAMLENKRMYQSFEDLKIDHMEREQIRLSDQVIAPSHYILQRAAQLGFSLAGTPLVIKNCFGRLAQAGKTRRLAPGSAHTPITELVFFGRHEDRKGIALFCDVVDRLAPVLAQHHISVTFLGGLGLVRGQPSGVYLLERAHEWPLDIQVLAYLDRDQAARYISRRPGALVLMPSVENSPYTVVEAMAAGVAFVTSNEGGAAELMATRDRTRFTADLTARAMAAQVQKFIDTGARAAAFDETAAAVADAWLVFHAQAPGQLSRLRRADQRRNAKKTRTPKVVLGITHYERPAKLLDAIWSAVRQTYTNLEIVVVDDGSKSPEAVASLKLVQQILARVGGRLIRQPNKYLGAARNAIAAQSQSDYLIFLDDDNMAKPELVQTLVDAALASNADVTTCMSHFMPEARRADAIARLDAYTDPLSYCPTVGPVAVGLFENCFGDATALIRRKTFDDIKGYTELHGVGYEDYEFFLRCKQAGKTVTVCPEQLYIYEIGKTGMLAAGSHWCNQQRILDAISPEAIGADAIKMVLEMNAGKTVAEQERGRNRWLFETRYPGVSYDALLDPQVPLPTRLATLADLADKAQAPRWAAAFRRAATPGEHSAPALQPGTLGRSRVIPRALVQAAAGVDPLWQSNMQAYALFLADKPGEAAALVLDQMALAQSIDAPLVNLLVRILRYSDFVPATEFVQRLFGCVNQVGDDPALTPLLWTALVLCCTKAGNTHALAALWQHIVAHESQQYCKAYPDVEAAIAQGHIASALRHYCKHGANDRRSGFAVAASLAKDVSAHLRCPPGLLQITQALQTAEATA
jgi:glycosyltransferase involved in cell wall biosynthesis/GT2 family glycosyltransferase